MIIIQARQHSARFPDKWEHEIAGVSILDRVYDACEQTSIRPIVVATPDVAVATYCGLHHMNLYLHSRNPNDLIERFLAVLEAFEAERCLRVTGDCPYHFPQEMEWVWKHGQDVDFCTNGWPHDRTTIDGVDCETYSLRLLRWMDRNVKKAEYREHLPLWFYKLRGGCVPKQFTYKALRWPVNLSHLKTSIDTPEDIDRMRKEELI